MTPVGVAPQDVRKGQKLVLNGSQVEVVNVREGRDPGGVYLIVVVEFSNETYADFRFYGNRATPFFVAPEPAEVDS